MGPPAAAGAAVAIADIDPDRLAYERPGLSVPGDTKLGCPRHLLLRTCWL